MLTPANIRDMALYYEWVEVVWKSRVLAGLKLDLIKLETKIGSCASGYLVAAGETADRIL